MDFKRSDRLGEVIKEEISLVLQDEINDPKIGFITVVGVRMSDDLRIAKIYYSVYGGEEDEFDAINITPGIKFQPTDNPNLEMGL